MKKVSPLLIALMCASLCASLSVAQAQNVRQVSLVTNDIIYDAHTAKIYASVPSSAGAGGNSITTIDPVTGMVGTPVFVGSEPNNLAVSDDGQFLYVGLDGAAAVRRVNLPAQTAGLQFSLGGDAFFGPYYVASLAVLPGSPHSVAVARRYLNVSPDIAGVAVFDDAVQRPTTTPGHDGGYFIAFNPASGILYGTADYGSYLYAMTASASGIVNTNSLAGVAIGEIAFDGGQIYSISGQAVDPAAQALLGKFTGASATYFGGYSTLASDAPNGHVFFLTTDPTGNSSTAQIIEYDTSTYRPVGALIIPGVSGRVSNLITYGAGGLAFRTSVGQIFLIGSRDLPGLASLTLSATILAAGATATGTVSLTQPAPTGGVTIALSAPNAQAAAVPTSVMVPAGARSATFPLRAGAVTNTTNVTITAGYGVQSSEATLAVQDAAGDPGHPVGIRVVNLPTNDIIYDAHTAKIYASVPSGTVIPGGNPGNSIVALDPLTGAMDAPVFVGSEPDNLALSDDGTALYVGLDGAAAVRRFDTAAQLPGLQFSLGRDSFLGPLYVQQIVTVPGTTDSVAVAEKYLNLSPANAGVAIFDNGVPRAAVVQRGQYEYDSLAFSSDPTKLYAYDNEDTGFGFSRLGVGSGGVSVLNGAGNLFSGFGVTIKYDGGLVYSSAGAVVDPEAQALVGSFSGVGSDPGSNISVRPDVADGRVFFLSSNPFGGQNSTATIQAYDPNTFLPAGSLAIPNAIGYVSSLTRWGTDGLAFRTSGGQIFLIRTSLIPNTQPAPTSVILSPPQVAGGVAATGIVTLAAPAPSGGVTVWLSSSNPDVASFPASLAVAAGQTSATFTVTTRPVTSKTFITVSAVSGGTSASAILTVQVPTHAYILWNNPDGRATLWLINPDGSFGISQTYGPYTDAGGTWQAIALATGPDGVSRILWRNPDGQATLWRVNPDGSFSPGPSYGPYADAGGLWQAVACSVGRDSVAHILWRNPDGQATLWQVNADSSFSPGPSYGPYTDGGGTWQATALATGPDGVSRILWRNPDGQATLWRVNADRSFSPGPSYGPYSDGGGLWQAAACSVGPDNVAHILWRNPDGRATLWQVNADGSFGISPSYGPYTDAGGTWQAVALATGSDGVNRILWRNPDGQATLWSVNADSSFGISPSYGPYTDAGGTWQAVADSAGP